MADTVVTGERSMMGEFFGDAWEEGKDLWKYWYDGQVAVDKESAKNPSNTANPNGTLTDAQQSQTAPATRINPMMMYIGGGVGLLLLILVLVLALRKK